MKQSGFQTARDAACTLALFLSSVSANSSSSSNNDKRDEWMRKPGISFPTDAGTLFGARISVLRNYAKKPVLAVLKSWSPIMNTFGVVYDDKPDKVYNQNLRTMKWLRVEWEDDLFETSDLRPLCPGCAHPLGEGLQEWTFCKICGFNEPGCMSHTLLQRMNNDDPYRKTRVNYRDE